MSQRRHLLQGLTFKLALFYLLLAVPALALIQWTIVSLEFHELFEAVDSGRMAAMTREAADEIGQHWNSDEPPGHMELATRAEALVLRLERPQDGLAPSSYVMLELSKVPIAVGVYDTAGKVLATAPESGWLATPPPAGDASWGKAQDIGSVDLPGAESPERVRRVLAAIRDGNGQLRGFLLTELRLPLPWRQLTGEKSFEWPILLVYLVVFSLATAFFMVRWVTRRLNTIADAAESWSEGDFSTLIPDESGDELGRLSRDLNRMACELMSLMQSRRARQPAGAPAHRARPARHGQTEGVRAEPADPRGPAPDRSGRRSRQDPSGRFVRTHRRHPASARQRAARTAQRRPAARIPRAAPARSGRALGPPQRPAARIRSRRFDHRSCHARRSAAAHCRGGPGQRIAPQRRDSGRNPPPSQGRADCADHRG